MIALTTMMAKIRQGTTKDPVSKLCRIEVTPGGNRVEVSSISCSEKVTFEADMELVTWPRDVCSSSTSWACAMCIDRNNNRKVKALFMQLGAEDSMVEVLSIMWLTLLVI